MPRGVIKYFSDYRGYGFIRCEDSPAEKNPCPDSSVYVHYSQISGEGSPREGQTVSFDLKNSSRGTEAVNVHPLT